MLRFEPTLPGFTTWVADGHGLGFSSASIGERVRGRIKRAILVAVMPREAAEGLLQKIKTDVPVPNITYWIEPVDSFGHLAAADATPTPALLQNTKPTEHEVKS
jgi:Protein of unknown function (DUF3240)